ncbi:hypothetical protein [Accumulibacter sp.]|uniref:hypothetical protein n=1 Tax=Accumulibacter sp. TaxID=2053492 RepID=UPI001A505C77|nr:hypothetical protein [Accumulibacter sp.]MBL8374132.1 hypothetical protein [Accumulibacter sp.]
MSLIDNQVIVDYSGLLRNAIPPPLYKLHIEGLAYSALADFMQSADLRPAIDRAIERTMQQMLAAGLELE